MVDEPLTVKLHETNRCAVFHGGPCTCTYYVVTRDSALHTAYEVDLYSPMQEAPVIKGDPLQSVSERVVRKMTELPDGMGYAMDKGWIQGQDSPVTGTGSLDPKTSGYYDRGGICCQDYADAKQFNGIEHGILRYLTRWRFKGNPERDLEKLVTYGQMLLARFRARKAGYEAMEHAP